jgi:hypothetical protein
VDEDAGLRHERERLQARMPKRLRNAIFPGNRDPLEQNALIRSWCRRSGESNCSVAADNETRNCAGRRERSLGERAPAAAAASIANVIFASVTGA